MDAAACALFSWWFCRPADCQNPELCGLAGSFSIGVIFWLMLMQVCHLRLPRGNFLIWFVPLVIVIVFSCRCLLLAAGYRWNFKGFFLQVVVLLDCYLLFCIYLLKLPTCCFVSLVIAIMAPVEHPARCQDFLCLCRKIIAELARLVFLVISSSFVRYPTLMHYFLD